MNNSIDDLEIKLRNLIVRTLKEKTSKDDFETLITGEAKQQIKRRIEQYLEKHPNQTKDEFKSLSRSIQFCDIEHLKKIILKDIYWEFFKPTFKEITKVERYFDSFSELRHTIKHKRELTNLVLHEGKAAIEWFSMII